MKFRPVQRMSVVLDLEGNEKKLGTLAWSGKERRAYFEYTAEFLAGPLLVSPFHMMAAPGLFAAARDPFDGLHGLFNDSLPDGWGRLLLDRRLQRAGIDYNQLTPIDRLSAVGRTGMGALTYIPDLPDDQKQPNDADLDWFADQVKLVQTETDVADIDSLQGAQGGLPRHRCSPSATTIRWSRPIAETSSGRSIRAASIRRCAPSRRCWQSWNAPRTLWALPAAWPPFPPRS